MRTERTREIEFPRELWRVELLVAVIFGYLLLFRFIYLQRHRNSTFLSEIVNPQRAADEKERIKCSDKE